MTEASNVCALLEDARARIADPSRWTKMFLARNDHGYHVSAFTEDACCWCSLGSLMRSASEKDAWDYYTPACQELRCAAIDICGVGIVLANDTCDHATVLRMYDHAIIRCRTGQSAN
jgi:hypothetical protein